MGWWLQRHRGLIIWPSSWQPDRAHQPLPVIRKPGLGKGKVEIFVILIYSWLRLQAILHTQKSPRAAVRMRTIKCSPWIELASGMKYVLNTFSPTKFAPFRAWLRSAGEDGDAAPACTSKTPTSGAPRLSQLRCIKFTSVFHRGRKITFRIFFFLILMVFNKMPVCNHQSHSAVLAQPPCTFHPPALLCVHAFAVTYK